jgi:hypothetical protein
MRRMDLASQIVPPPELGAVSEVIRTWAVNFSPGGTTVCRFVLTNRGARVAIENKPVRYKSEATPWCFWRAEVLVGRQPSGPRMEDADDLVKAPEEDSGHRSVFSRHIDYFCMRLPASSKRRTRIRESLGLVRQHILSLMHPSARAAAGRFSFESGLRMFVYESIADDPSGRVAQAACTCPGLLILAAGMRYHSLDGACEQVFRNLSRGYALKRVVALAVANWFASLPGRRMEDHAVVLETQRLRVRRAGPLVRLAVLWTPSPERIIPEDIPQDERQNAAWFDLMAAVANAIDSPRLSSEQRTAFSAFASRHALALVRPGQVPQHGNINRPASTIASLVDYVAASGRVPSRNTNPERLVRESCAWHDDIWRRSQLARVPAETPLATLAFRGCERWTLDRANVSLLTTVGALAQEASTMRSCVASYLSSALAGQTFIFHAKILRAALTVELRDPGGALRIHQAAGRANRPPTHHEEEILRIWMDDVNEFLRCRGVGRKPRCRGSFAG